VTAPAAAGPDPTRVFVVPIAVEASTAAGGLCRPFIVPTAIWPLRGSGPRMIAQPSVYAADGFAVDDDPLRDEGEAYAAGPEPAGASRKSLRAESPHHSASHDSRGLSFRLDQDGYVIRVYARKELGSALDGERDGAPVAVAEG
jgi:hypothetical protein